MAAVQTFHTDKSNTKVVLYAGGFVYMEPLKLHLLCGEQCYIF